MNTFHNALRQLRPWSQPAIYFAAAMIAAIWASLSFHPTVEYDRSRLSAIQNTGNLTRVFEEHIIGSLTEIDRAIVLLRTSYKLSGTLNPANSINNPATHSDCSPR